MHNPEPQTRSGQQVPVDLSQPLVLAVHSLSGDVTIRAVDRPDVWVGGDDPGHWHDQDSDTGLTIEARDNRIEIRPRQHCDIGWSGHAGEFDLESLMGQISKAFRFAGPKFAAKAHNGFAGHGSPDIAIEVPRQTGGRVEVHSVSGDVRVEDFSGEIALTTMSGEIRVIRTSGRLDLQAVSGDVLVDDASGRLTARVASGDVRITSSQLEGFDTQTANGDILIDALLIDTTACSVHTASGDVVLSLRRPAAAGVEPAATLVFQTVAGDARVIAPFRQTDHRRWESGAGQPGPRIDITTVNGDLTATIESVEREFDATPAPAPAAASDFVQSTPPESPMPAAPVAEPDSDRERALAADFGLAPPRGNTSGKSARLAVLEAVERGEIDIEEALRRLDVEDAGANS